MFLLVMFLLWSRSSEKILYALCLTIWRYRSVATFISLEFLWWLTSDVLFLPIFNKTTKMLFHQFFIYTLLYILFIHFVYFVYILWFEDVFNYATTPGLKSMLLPSVTKKKFVHALQFYCFFFLFENKSN